MSPGIEMGADPRFAGRVVRLALVSVVVLGVIRHLAAGTTELGTAPDALLVTGWFLMPLLLVASLRRPRLRYALVVPATLVFLGVCGALLAVPAGAPAARAGWFLVAAGIAMGGLLGTWFWYRWFPVPTSLVDPFGRGRSTLVGVHVVLVVAGLVVAALWRTP